ncbi:hypothetical protein B0T14DRAFT_516904 [Immersiella caudata]|uniref:Secreted protein n=1 Tax=Immersiella caudata TaxID=314043 RepID=A0AA40C3J0_9PEZI|nr:hypothetical protein B0T14DRAFT_516904 [Immersiella caudata]
MRRRHSCDPALLLAIIFVATGASIRDVASTSHPHPAFSIRHSLPAVRRQTRSADPKALDPPRSTEHNCTFHRQSLNTFMCKSSGHKKGSF